LQNPKSGEYPGGKNSGLCGSSGALSFVVAALDSKMLEKDGQLNTRTQTKPTRLQNLSQQRIFVFRLICKRKHLQNDKCSVTAKEDHTFPTQGKLYPE